MLCRFVSLALFLALPVCAAEVFENFDVDPHWDGFNNLPEDSTLREVTQDFGYSATTHSGETPGEIGGTIQPDGAPAYYAKALAPLGFTKAFKASGTIFVPKGPGNTFLGFFNHATINEWRAPNALGFRINQRGDTFHMHTEFATSKWRASAGVFGRVDPKADRIYPIENPGDTRHAFMLEYLPDAGNGDGLIHATLDNEVSDCVVSAEHKKDGATFDRFGFLNIVKSVDSPGVLWLRDVEINGVREDLSKDPQWDARDNHKHYLSAEVRPRFNIGYVDSHFAGGAKAGEIGGLFFRGDCREAARLFYYGGKTGALSLDTPLTISGKLTLCRGVSDSTSLFGFFNATSSVEVNLSQSNATPKDFFGFAVEGPSGQGFYVYPVCRGSADASGGGGYDNAPHIYPDATQHDVSFTYDPAANNGRGEVRLTLDNHSMTWPLPEEIRQSGAHFDHLGFVSPWIDGNGQRIYLDDLHYTTAP